MRWDHNNWLIDGGEVYDRGSGGRLDVAVSPDALSEFQTLASNYTPDYGINSGGTVLMCSQIRNTKIPRRAVGSLTATMHITPHTTSSSSRTCRRRELPSEHFLARKCRRSDYQEQDVLFLVNEEWRKLVQGANPSVANTIPAPFFPTAGSDLELHPARWKSADCSCNRGPGQACDLPGGLS